MLEKFKQLSLLFWGTEINEHFLSCFPVFYVFVDTTIGLSTTTIFYDLESSTGNVRK